MNCTTIPVFSRFENGSIPSLFSTDYEPAYSDTEFQRETTTENERNDPVTKTEEQSDTSASSLADSSTSLKTSKSYSDELKAKKVKKMMSFSHRNKVEPNAIQIRIPPLKEPPNILNAKESAPDNDAKSTKVKKMMSFSQRQKLFKRF